MAQILVLLKYTVTWRMEVAMSILKHQKLITLFGLSLLMSLSSPAQAQWPTLDLTAIKEGISSKIELVKQNFAADFKAAEFTERQGNEGSRYKAEGRIGRYGFFSCHFYLIAQESRYDFH